MHPIDISGHKSCLPRVIKSYLKHGNKNLIDISIEIGYHCLSPTQMEALFSPTQNHDIFQWNGCGIDLSSIIPSLFTWLQLDAVKEWHLFCLTGPGWSGKIIRIFSFFFPKSDMENKTLQYFQKERTLDWCLQGCAHLGSEPRPGVQNTELVETQLPFHSLKEINHINYEAICPRTMLLRMGKEDQRGHGFLSPCRLSETKDNTKLPGRGKVEARSTWYPMLS